MLNVLILLIQCLARMFYLSIPGVVLALSIQTLVYRLTGISLYNELVKAVRK